MKNVFLAGLCSLFSLASLRATEVKVLTHQPVIPVLTQKGASPVLRIRVVKDTPSPLALSRLVCSLRGTTSPADIEKVMLYDAAPDGSMGKRQRAVASFLLQPATEEVTFTDVMNLEADTTFLWVAVRLKETISLDHRVEVACTALQTSEGSARITSTRPRVPLRVGVAVRQHGQDGVHTSRIPGIATSLRGTLLAIYDARYENSRDLQGHIDIAMNRSTDGGSTWQPMQIVLDKKQWGGLPEKYNGVSDACVLVDERTGHIYVAGLWMHGLLDGRTGKWVEGLTTDSTRWIHQWIERGSQPGVEVKQTCQFLITKSTDDGKTWSEPVNITAQTKRPEWWLYAPAPGHGITLKDGTLVFPTQGRDTNGLPFSNITWSKDGGRTWTTSNPAYHNTTECMAVELSDGSVMLNMRDNRNRGKKEGNGRRICVTKDLGETWTEHPTSRKALVESTCMASIHRHHYKQDGKERTLLLFCNPESYNSRDHMTLKVSFDDGMTWSEDKKILLDEEGSFGYSCITSVSESVIGVFYESSQAQMVFQQIDLKEWLD